MTQRIVGYACAGMAVAMMVIAVWFSNAAQSEAGLVSIGLGLALLLVAAMTLRVNDNRV